MLRMTVNLQAHKKEKWWHHSSYTGLLVPTKLNCEEFLLNKLQQLISKVIQQSQ